MTSATANGISIEYETFGDPGAAPVLLIMGLGGQLTAWDPDFCRALAAAGFFVIRYDNRDVGLSTWFDDAGDPDVGALLAGTASSPYAITDLAADAAGLLDALGIASAHIVGVSMGGMIAQTFAIDFPERTRTLVSIMSTTGDPTVGQPHPDALAMLMVPPATSREEAIEQSVDTRGLGVDHALVACAHRGREACPQPSQLLSAAGSLIIVSQHVSLVRGVSDGSLEHAKNSHLAQRLRQRS